jgi:hypothetical protein
VLATAGTASASPPPMGVGVASPPPRLLSSSELGSALGRLHPLLHAVARNSKARPSPRTRMSQRSSTASGSAAALLVSSATGICSSHRHSCSGGALGGVSRQTLTTRWRLRWGEHCGCSYAPRSRPFSPKYVLTGFGVGTQGCMMEKLCVNQPSGNWSERQSTHPDSAHVGTDDKPSSLS